MKRGALPWFILALLFGVVMLIWAGSIETEAVRHLPPWRSW